VIAFGMWLACHAEPADTFGPAPTVTDTGWFSVEPTTSACEATVVATEPSAGATDWYWRSPVTVFVSASDPAAVTAHLRGPSGVEVPTTLGWAPEGLSLTLTAADGLAPDADHVLVVDDCAGRTEVPFRTSAFGQPLIGGPGALVGKTWELDFVHASWLEPQGLGPLLTLYFTTPVLLGARFATPTAIDLLGAPGKTNLDGFLVQDLTAPTWDFPLSDFATAPYLIATSDNVVFDFEDVSVPIEDFRFESTFSADGATLGGTVVSGLADTRNLGVFANDPDNPSAICALAATLGTVCVPCQDGGPYCLDMLVADVAGTLVTGLTLQERN
jgi:hypothetical protein